MDLLKRDALFLEDIRDKSCIIVTNYNGLVQDDLVPHLYDFHATVEEVKRGLNISNEKTGRN